MTVSSVRRALRQLRAGADELLEAHDGRDLGDFARYADDPEGFFREVLREERLWPGLLRIIEAVRDKPLTVVRSANSMGKDWTVTRLALWFVYAHGGLVLLTGPTERQVREVCMREVARAFGRAKELPGELYATSLRLGQAEHAGILAFTSTEASRLTGFHAPKVMAVITEAQGVEDYCFEGLLACATGEHDRLVAVGNPLAPSGRFYTVSDSAGWESIQLSGLDHPNVTEGRVVIPGAITRQFVARMAAEYGEGSGVYKARVLGEFPDESAYGLFRRSWLDAAAERHQSGVYLKEAATHEPIVAIDPARYGPDMTCLAVRRGPVLERLVTWSKLDTMESAERAARELEDVEGVRPAGEKDGKPEAAGGWVVVDEVGTGAGVADRLSELGFRVIGYNGGRSPTQAGEGKFANRRAESWWRLRELLEAGAIALPRDELLTDELTGIRWHETADGKVALEAKDDLRSRLGRSPDRADAVVMAFAESVPQPAFDYWSDPAVDGFFGGIGFFEV